MKRIGKRQREDMIARQIQAAVVGLQIPLMSISKIYAEGERLLTPGIAPATREEFVAKFQEYALANGATRAGVQPDPRAAAMVSEAAELLEKHGDYELGNL